MAKRELQLGPWTWLAGAVALASGAALLWTKSISEKLAEAEGPPPENVDCDPGFTYDAPTNTCLPAAGGKPVVPSLLPDTSALKGPILPPRAKVLLVGGELAAGLARALAKELTTQEKMHGYPVTPSAISVADGAPVLYTFEAISAGLGVSGVPKAPECQACPPDLVIVFAGEYNLHWGPVNEDTRKAIAHIADTYAVYARNHFPNIVWVMPPSNPDMVDPPFKNELATAIFTMSESVRPGRSAFINPKAFERVYPGTPVPGAAPMMVDNARPNDAGYAALARQVAAVLVAWYASHPTGAAA